MRPGVNFRLRDFPGPTQILLDQDLNSSSCESREVGGREEVERQAAEAHSRQAEPRHFAEWLRVLFSCGYIVFSKQPSGAGKSSMSIPIIITI